MFDSEIPQIDVGVVAEESVKFIAIHGPSGRGKSTAKIDILLWAAEQGIVKGIASNIELGLLNGDGIRICPFEFERLVYLTQLGAVHGKAIGLDELNRSLDGREWQDSKRQKLQILIDMSRRRGCKYVLATSIRITGIDLGFRNSVTLVVEPQGVLTPDGYPVYRVYDSYDEMEEARRKRIVGGKLVHGYHRLDVLKMWFSSIKEPVLQPYPPIQDFNVEADRFLEWSKKQAISMIHEGKNGGASLVSLSELWIHLRSWNREVHDVPYSLGDLEHVMSRVIGKENEVLEKLASR